MSRPIFVAGLFLFAMLPLACLAEQKIRIIVYDDASPGFLVLQVQEDGTIKNWGASEPIFVGTTPTDPEDPEDPPSTFKNKVVEASKASGLSQSKKQEIAQLYQAMANQDFTSVSTMLNSTDVLFGLIATDQAWKTWKDKIDAAVQSEEFSSLSSVKAAFVVIADVLKSSTASIEPKKKEVKSMEEIPG